MSDDEDEDEDAAESDISGSRRSSVYSTDASSPSDMNHAQDDDETQSEQMYNLDNTAQDSQSVPYRGL